MQHFFGQIKTKVFSSDILAQNKTQRGRAELFWTDFKSVLFGYSFTNFLEKCYFLYSSKKKNSGHAKFFGQIITKVFFLDIIPQTRTQRGHETFF